MLTKRCDRIVQEQKFHASCTCHTPEETAAVITMLRPDLTEV